MLFSIHTFSNHHSTLSNHPRNACRWLLMNSFNFCVFYRNEEEREREKWREKNGNNKVCMWRQATTNNRDFGLIWLWRNLWIFSSSSLRTVEISSLSQLMGQFSYLWWNLWGDNGKAFDRMATQRAREREKKLISKRFLWITRNFDNL